jgi:rSAM/selenodomain-associated transferase 1
MIGIWENRRVRPAWSVVIPALDADAALAALLPYLKETGGQDVELVVSSPAAARHHDARLVRAPAGRGAQLAAGGAAATGERLLFLHADTRPPRDWRGILERSLSLRPDQAYAFSLSYEDGGLAASLVAWGANLRSRLRSEPYGDQGLAMSAKTYRAAGGYKPLPLFEDVEFTRRLRARGGVTTLEAAVTTSPDRLARHGAFANVWRNARLKSAWEGGADPDKLWCAYTGRPPRREALAVFAKPPIEGRVKTRLAADIGPARAVAVYRELAERTFAVAREYAAAGGAAYLYYDGELDDFAVKSGLGVRRQPAGGLGERLAAAHAELFADGFSRVATIGTDCPSVTPSRLAGAFAALRESAAVFGPSEDGGYWLVGQSVAEPGLFADIDWSTEKVLAQSLDRAASLDLTVSRLDTLRDVDNEVDLRAWREG